MQTKIEKISPLSAFAVNNYMKHDCLSCDFLSFREKLSCAVISHPEKSREWKGARMAIKETMDCLNIPYPGFYKDEHGKSHPMDNYGYVSLTHSNGWAAAIFHKEMPVGIDMDFVRDKVVRLGPKFLDPIEMGFLDNDPLLHTIAWSAKETIYKCQGKKGISLKENILLQPEFVERMVIDSVLEVQHSPNLLEQSLLLKHYYNVVEMSHLPEYWKLLLHDTRLMLPVIEIKRANRSQLCSYFQ